MLNSALCRGKSNRTIKSKHLYKWGSILKPVGVIGVSLFIYMVLKNFKSTNVGQMLTVESQQARRDN